MITPVKKENKALALLKKYPKTFAVSGGLLALAAGKKIHSLMPSKMPPATGSTTVDPLFTGKLWNNKLNSIISSATEKSKYWEGRSKFEEYMKSMREGHNGQKFYPLMKVSQDETPKALKPVKAVIENPGKSATLALALASIHKYRQVKKEYPDFLAYKGMPKVVGLAAPGMVMNDIAQWGWNNPVKAAAGLSAAAVGVHGLKTLLKKYKVKKNDN